MVELRKKFLNDFEFWAKHSCKIRTKDGQIQSLVLNRVQKRFLQAITDQLTTTGRVRMVVLKARQQGLSTVIAAWQYFRLSQNPAQKGLVMAHEADSTTTLFDMYKRIHDNMPSMLKPSTKYSSRTELVFDKLDTGLRVATAGGRGVARGETLTVTHLSEVGFWPTAFAAANFNGLLQAVPESDGTAVFIESTANGMTGAFRDMWTNAVNGTNGYLPFFSPWFESDEYRTAAPENFMRSPAEDALSAEYGLDNDQLFWRRRKIATNGSELFRQEYPSTADEAFITSGRPVFNPDYIVERLKTVPAPVMRMAVEEGSLQEHPLGELLVYVDHPELDAKGNDTGKRTSVDGKETYVIGADVGMGVRGGDPSVAQVLDSQLRQVAVWRGVVQPDYFAKILTTLGYHFNSALIGVERNNHGLLTCVKLRDDNYPFIYTDQAEGMLDERDTIRIGLFVNEATKPLIIDKLRAVDREHEIEINDETTLKEMLTFVVTESGKMEAEAGEHDDTVMSLAIANHIHEGKWQPVAVPDEIYSNAI